MSSIIINIDNGGEPITVNAMRRRLAQVLSRLRGDQMVTFALVARLPHYTPDPVRRTLMPSGNLVEGVNIVHGELARPENH